MENYFEKATKFASENIVHRAKEIDEKGEFPKDIFEKIGDCGYLNLLIPKELGGEGKSLVEHADVCRAFSKACSTVGLCYMMHNVGLMCVLTYGSDELKREVCKDVVENKKFLALAYSELGTGTHFYISDVTTKYEGDKVTFNGLKSMVTSGTFASYYLVLAQSEDKMAIDNWVFPIGERGLEFIPESWHGLGMRGNVSCQMKIDNVTLDKKYRLGQAGSGQEQVFNVVAPFFIIGLAAIYSGLTNAVFEDALSHATNRKYPSGQSLAEIETVQIHLSRIYSQMNSAICSTVEAARAGANGEADALAKILSARIVASEAAIETSRLAMRIGGGKAYNKEGNFERYLRDSFAGQIMAPSVDVLIVWLGKAVAGLQLP